MQGRTWDNRLYENMHSSGRFGQAHFNDFDAYTDSLTTEKGMSTVMKVLQLKEEIRLDTGFSADVVTIHRDALLGKIEKS